MPLVLQAYTTPANTLVTADTGAPPGSLPTAPIIVPRDPEMPLIDGNEDYIFSPFDGPGATVTLESVFTIPAASLPIVTLGLPITVFFTYAADLTAVSTVSLQAIDLLGIVVLDVDLFTESNLGNKQNAVVGSGDFLLTLAVGLLSTVQVTVTTTVTAPLLTPYPFGTDGDYLGQLQVYAIGPGAGG